MQLILLVEDDPNLRATLTWMLADAFPDCAVQAAATGRTFLALLEQQAPDLVLLDLHLPDTTGLLLYELIRRRAELGAVPVLFVTANPEFVRDARLAGSYGCLAKPFDVAHLVTQVHTLLARQPIRYGGRA
jgi:DNA-binding response OmpR family regulator